MATIFVKVEENEAIASININGSEYILDTDDPIPNPAQALAVGTTLLTSVIFPIELNGTFPDVPNVPLPTELTIDQKAGLAAGNLLINGGLPYSPTLVIDSAEKAEGSLSND